MFGLSGCVSTVTQSLVIQSEKFVVYFTGIQVNQEFVIEHEHTQFPRYFIKTNIE